MSDAVIPHYTLFGSLVFAVELVAGVLLTLGVFTRVGALVGTVQAVIITLLVVQAPNEWVFTYLMLIALNLACLVGPAGERLSVEPALRRLRRSRP